MEKEEYSEEEIISAVSRFKEITDRGESCYFDIFEYEGIIDYFFDIDHIAKASKAIDSACSQHPESISLKMRKAQLCIYKGEADNALNILVNIVDLESNNTDMLFLSGNALLLKNKPEEAEKQFSKLIEIETDDLDGTLYDIASACELCSYNEMAMKYYNKYLVNNPYSKIVWNTVANLYYENENLEKAIEAYDFAIAIDPDFSPAILCKADCLILSKNYKEAITTLLDYHKLEPEDLHVYSFLGECYMHLEEYDKAVIYFHKVISK